jgi:hypothetical protein
MFICDLEVANVVKSPSKADINIKIIIQPSPFNNLICLKRIIFASKHGTIYVRVCKHLLKNKLPIFLNFISVLDYQIQVLTIAISNLQSY